MLQAHDTTLLHWRNTTVRLDPARYAYVYLIHFARPIGNPEKTRGQASHYLGSTGALEHRLLTHRNGNGSCIMAAVSKAGVDWQVSRLWRFETCEQARAFEKRLKRHGHGPRHCPLCNPHQVTDPYTMLRRGHNPVVSRPQGKRRPMMFVRREVSR